MVTTGTLVLELLFRDRTEWWEQAVLPGAGAWEGVKGTSGTGKGDWVPLGAQEAREGSVCTAGWTGAGQHECRELRGVLRGPVPC